MFILGPGYACVNWHRYHLIAGAFHVVGTGPQQNKRSRLCFEGMEGSALRHM